MPRIVLNNKLVVFTELLRVVTTISEPYSILEAVQLTIVASHPSQIEVP